MAEITNFTTAQLGRCTTKLACQNPYHCLSEKGVL